MESKSRSSTRRVLEPVERLSEILFGLIMVLTFTGSISVATADRAETKAVLIGAIGCNIAWGIIDAIMYLMACLHERGVEVRTLESVRAAASREQAHSLIRDKLPAAVSDELRPEALDRILGRIKAMPPVSQRPELNLDDLRGALAVFLIVVMSTVPVILPFIFLQDLSIAMRISNAIAVAMLALIGFAYGRASGISAWWMSGSMVLLGCVLVGLTLALGG